MTPRQQRTLRAAAASSAATLLAAVSHTIGGGAAPHPLLVVSMAVLLTPLSALLVGQSPRRLRVAATVLVAQGAFHVVFQTLGGTVTSVGIPGGHQHGPLSLGPLSPMAAPDPAMLGSHLAAAALTVLLLWHGEQALRAIGGWVRVALRSSLPVPRLSFSAPSVLRSAFAPLPAPGHDAAVSRRGPPRVSCG